MPRDFDDVVSELATSRGGFALWLGAGASIALSKGNTPTWSGLINDLRSANGHPVRPAPSLPQFTPPPDDMPDQVELLSQLLGHAAFRRALRQKLVEPLNGRLDLDTFLYQAVIGARSSAVVSFNIEWQSALPFVFMRGGGSFIVRTFLELTPQAAVPQFSATPGTVGGVAYFPHGLLDAGNVVMSRSEYDRHRMSVAVGTAVQLCLGGDLVIVGMGLGDSYLRHAILEHRRWIREVFWFDQSFGYAEWARVARVTCVPVPYDKIWSGLADGFVAAEKSVGSKPGRLETGLDLCRKELSQGTFLSKLANVHAEFKVKLDATAADLAARAGAGSAEATQQAIMVACLYIEMGLELPDCLATDPRFLPSTL